LRKNVKKNEVIDIIRESGTITVKKTCRNHVRKRPKHVNLFELRRIILHEEEAREGQERPFIQMRSR